jgi:hypothetical protein
MDLNDAAAQLYGLSPAEFTAARNALVKVTTDRSEAAAIKSLRKPTLPAWLANQLVRAVPDRVDELTQLGADLRAAYLSRDGGRLRDLTPQRHRLVTELVKTARGVAKDAGYEVTAAVADKLTETLDAALIDPDAAAMLRTGRLTSALRHVGFGVVDETGEPAQVAPIKVTRASTGKAAAKPPAKADRSKMQERVEARRRQELQNRLAELDTEYERAEADRIAAESELDANEHHISDLETTITRLTEELDHARTQLKQVRANTVRLERALARATRLATVAARRRDAARGRLDTSRTDRNENRN